MSLAKYSAKSKERGGSTVVYPAVFFIFLAIAVAITGCSKKGVKPEAGHPDYMKTLDAQTRSVKIYSGLDSILYLTATYKTLNFRQAYVERYADGYQLGEAYRSALMEREREESDKYNEIFFTAYTPDARWNDFDAQNSVWRLYLEDSAGNRLIPVSVRKINGNEPLLREFFPYFDLWSSAYVVRFPKYSETGTEPIPGEKTSYLRLVVTGVPGNGTVEWRFK
jgi:hypothetical protein